MMPLERFSFAQKIGSTPFALGHFLLFFIPAHAHHRHVAHLLRSFVRFQGKKSLDPLDLPGCAKCKWVSVHASTSVDLFIGKTGKDKVKVKVRVNVCVAVGGSFCQYCQKSSCLFA